MISFSNSKFRMYTVCAVYLLLSLVLATATLDGDEFTFIKEPYELLGGDYTAGYLKDNDYKKAAETVAKSYFLYWQYRSMFSPIIREEHKRLFAQEETRFGYVKPESVERGDPNALALYQSRLIVPEPDRFYRHGAGKPLLPALLSIPQLGLTAVLSSGRELLHLQFSSKYHPLFILTRLVQIVAGLISILMVYVIIKREFDADIASLGAAVFAFFPLTVIYFPNIHHDSILVPFFVGSSYLLLKGKYVKGGLVYGLALASKNTAIFLVPAFVIYYLLQAYELYRDANVTESKTYLIRKARELTIFGVLALATLTPFANPVSYVSEILTPITHREFDPRGQDVRRFTLSGRLHVTEGAPGFLRGINVVQGVVGVGKVRGFNSIFILLAILGAFLCLQADKRNISKFSLVMLLMILPYGVVFQYEMSYRSLIFVPFFTILCVEVLNRRNVKTLVWILFSITLLYSIEAMRQ